MSEFCLDISVLDFDIEFLYCSISTFKLDQETKIDIVCVFVNQSHKADRLSGLSFIAESGLHQFC